MAKISNSQIFARGPFSTRILTVFSPKDLPLVLRPHTLIVCIVCRVLVDNAFAHEADADGAGRCCAGTRGGIGNGEGRGGELDEKEEKGGGQSLHCPCTIEGCCRSMCGRSCRRVKRR